MSPATTNARSRTSSTVGLHAVARAELVRTRGTFTWGWLAASPVMALYALALSQASIAAGLNTATSQWNGNILAWLSFYPNAVALPLAALLGAMAQWREQRWNHGGTLWRNVPQHTLAAARALVLSVSCLLAQVLLLVPIVAAGVLAGHGWGPWERYLPFALLQWVASTSAALLGLLAARLFGAAAVGLAPTAAFGWSLAGALQAESPHWLAQPWTWFIRGTLPLLGVHGNSVSLEPGQAAWGYSWQASLALQTGLCLLLAALVLASTRGRWALAPAHLGLRPGRHAQLGGAPTGHRHTVAPTKAVPAPPQAGPATKGWTALAATSWSPRPWRALARVLPWPTWCLLAVVLVTLTWVVRLVYSPSASLGLLGLVGMPVSATTAGVMAWTSQAEARRCLLLRRVPWRLDAASLALTTGFLTAVTVVAWVAGGGATAPAGAASGYMLLVAPAVLAAVASVSYTLTMTTGVAVSAVVGVIGLLTSLVLDGNEALVTVLWPFGPWGWGHAVTLLPQVWPLTVIGASALTALSLALSGWGGRAAALRAGQPA